VKRAEEKKENNTKKGVQLSQGTTGVPSRDEGGVTMSTAISLREREKKYRNRNKAALF
jgi:hypothetical protein